MSPLGLAYSGPGEPSHYIRVRVRSDVFTSGRLWGCMRAVDSLVPRPPKQIHLGIKAAASPRGQRGAVALRPARAGCVSDMDRAEWREMT